MTRPPTDLALHDAPTRPLPPRQEGRHRPLEPVTGGVVVVEHDPEHQSRLARSLTDRGAQVVATGSPEAALTLMSQWSPELVLVNESLPGQSGLELARRIREDHPSAHVVLMTSSASEELRASASMAGALGLLVKPFHLDALVELLRSIDLSVLELLQPGE
jgi:DNA-binding response OmpR family regulator